MFDIGFLELVVIMVMALLVLGPERLPKAARTVGYWFGKARRYVEGMKAQVEAEFDSSEVKRLLHNQEIQIRELQNKLQNTEDYVNTDYHNQFEDSNDPGTEQIASRAELEKNKPSGPQYEMVEEADDRWSELQESNPIKESKAATLNDQVAETKSLDKSQ